MTTELEEQFFKTFGIEPIEYRKIVPWLKKALVGARLKKGKR